MGVAVAPVTFSSSPSLTIMKRNSDKQNNQSKLYSARARREFRQVNSVSVTAVIFQRELCCRCCLRGWFTRYQVYVTSGGTLVSTCCFSRYHHLCFSTSFERTSSRSPPPTHHHHHVTLPGSPVNILIIK